MAPSTDRELDLLLSKLRKIQVMDAVLGGGVSDGIALLLLLCFFSTPKRTPILYRTFSLVFRRTRYTLLCRGLVC